MSEYQFHKKYTQKLNETLHILTIHNFTNTRCFEIRMMRSLCLWHHSQKIRNPQNKKFFWVHTRIFFECTTTL